MQYPARLARQASLYLLIWLLIGTVGMISGQTTVVIDRKPTATITVARDAAITSLLAKMTLAEKTGQLTLYNADYDVNEPTIQQIYLDLIKAGKMGAVFNAYNVRFTRKLQQLAVSQTRLGIPLLFGFDVIHGFKTVFPIPLAEAASWNLQAIEKSARIAATEAAAAGLHWTFAPMVDIARDPRWGRIAEGAGEDPYLGSLIASARVKGFQGNDLGAVDTILACAKHYIAYGAAEGGRDYNTVDISPRTLHEIYLPPFKAAVDANVATLMTAFNELNGMPCTANQWLLKAILRDQWGFRGFVVSDYTAINELMLHGLAPSLDAAASLAINAGVDMDMQGGAYQHHLAKLVAQGHVSRKTIDDAVRRILRLKFQLGLLADPYHYCNEQREKDAIMNQQCLTAALDVARKSIVLLKNRDDALPLAKNRRVVAVIGPLANNQKELIGSWSGAGNYSQAVSLLTGIRAKVSPQTKVLYAPGCTIAGDSTAGFPNALAIAGQADVVIAALGEEAMMSGEAACRSSLKLPGVQELLLQKLHATGKPIVLVVMNGRPLNLSWADRHIPAIVEAWFLGTQAGNAIAEVLFGDYNPSGKLPVTFPRTIGQVPIYYNHKNSGRPADRAEKYTSKYLDIDHTPLYPFGYGLSYTRFHYADLQLSASKIAPSQNLTISVQLKNVGKYPGCETVQLYIRDEHASITRPVKQLRRFRQVHLPPGASHKVEFQLTSDDLAFYNCQMKRVVEPGYFQVMVGTSSAEYLSARFQVDQDSGS